MYNKFRKLEFFGDEAIGKLFEPDGLFLCEKPALIPTIMHGRSIAVRISDYEWILIKGGGWNYLGPQVYISKKEQELVFGLYSSTAGKRELAVSKKLEEISDDFPKVLYYKEFANYDLPSKYDFLKTIKFSNGNLVNPCLLYTKVKCPYRIADIIYLKPKEREEVIENCCKYFGVQKKDYIKKVASILAKNIAIMHKNGFVNDTLEFSNVTMLGEIVDYELITAPGVSFDDGTDGSYKVYERREKEILYAAEIIFQLYKLLFMDSTFFDCYKLIVKSYNEIYPEFVDSNDEIKKILKGESFIVW